MELGPMVSSPVYEEGFLFILTLTGRIFCWIYQREKSDGIIILEFPMVSSPLIVG
jgi:hypothetical protein